MSTAAGKGVVESELYGLKVVIAMARLSLREIREAIRHLPEGERQQLIDELLDEELTNTHSDVKALEAALDRADRGELIDDADLGRYMATRRKERQGGRSGH